MSTFIQRLIARATRRKRWEREACNALATARTAAAKLQIEMMRGSAEPKAEYDWLVAKRDRLAKLSQGPDAFDQEDKP
jgi:hypothetical protein